ncbi:hypothetical protein GCM10007977_103550 [Dactylosporangium sucinum]|uniref:Uncharacterized protein n=1 Tax=Dactylosporangium sucinum TaxID=1424081 RepID=A0A917X727_9ACTN|nr:hypothetical protein GCM10007977_103550 [Dactylosporangium sucinum]
MWGSVVASDGTSPWLVADGLGERVEPVAVFLRDLQNLAGRGWQARWQAAEELHGSKWQTLPIATAGTAAAGGDGCRKELTRGLGCLIKLRLVKPSYAFLTTYGPTTRQFRAVVRAVRNLVRIDSSTSHSSRQAVGSDATTPNRPG